MTNEWQRVPDTADFIIFKKGDEVYAKDGSTGEIVYQNADIGKVINHILEENKNKALSIKIQPEKYDLYTTINVDMNNMNVILVGDAVLNNFSWGMYSGTTITAHGVDAIHITTSGGSNLGFTMEGIILEGTGGNTTGIEIGDETNDIPVSYFILRDIIVKSFDTGLKIYGFAYHIQDSIFYNNNDFGIYASQRAGEGTNIFENVHITQTTNTAMHLENGMNYILRDVDIESNGKALEISNTYGVQIYDMWTESNNDGIYLDAANGITVVGGNINDKIVIGKTSGCRTHRYIGVYNYGNRGHLSFDVEDGSDIIIDVGYSDTDANITGNLSLTTIIKGHYSWSSLYLAGQPVKFDGIFIPTSTPSNPKVGAMYFDTSAGKLYIYDGSAWKSVALS